MNDISIFKNNLNKYIFGLTLILISNLCLYTSTSIVLYLTMSMIGIVYIWFFYLIENNFKVVIDSCVLWLTAVFVMFTMYGTLFLRKGVYNWDKMIFTYVQLITIFICLRTILKEKYWWKYLFRAFSVSMLFTVFYLVVKEGSLILADTSRIGNSLSGDVNVVADCMGILLMLIFYCYLQEQNKLAAIVTIVGLIFMLLTGSKRVAFVFGIMLFMSWPYAKKRLHILLIVAIVLSVGIYAIFESNYFYNLIGHRFIEMYMQLTGRGSAAYYTSTNARVGMIKEGFRIFLTKPLFGGGMEYFSSQSRMWSYYNYSHCNYVEMLCTFGLVGTSLFYYPYLHNLRLLLKRKKNIDGSIIAICMLFLMIIIDWVAVSFTDICIYYFPIILSFALLETNKNKR